MTTGGVASSVLGFGWLAVLANAAIRNRERAAGSRSF
jgi:hypothetical protein